MSSPYEHGFLLQQWFRKFLKNPKVDTRTQALTNMQKLKVDLKRAQNLSHKDVLNGHFYFLIRVLAWEFPQNTLILYCVGIGVLTQKNRMKMLVMVVLSVFV